ncbi:MAG: MFS transporter [Candidatus Heimdallarchaeaceae archaeon]
MNQESEVNGSKPNLDKIMTSEEFEAKTKSSLKNWITFEKNEIFLLLSYFFFGVAFANYEPYAPFWLMKLFGESSFLILGLVMVIPSIVVIFGTSIWGFLADLFGTKKFVILGMAAYIFMFFSLIFTTSSTYFLIALLIGTLIGSAQSSNFFALATKSVKKPKSIILAKITITISLSWTIMSPIVGFIYDNASNSMNLQLAIAVVACLIATILILFVKEKRNTKLLEPIKKEEKGSSTPKLAYFIFIAILTIVFTFQLTGGFWPYTSIYFLDVLNIKGSYYSLFLIIKTLLAIPLSFLLGNVKKTEKIAGLIVLFTGWSVNIYVLMTFFPSIWFLILIIQAIPMYPLTNVSFYSLVTKYSPRRFRGTAFGIFNAIGTAGYVAGILILGAIADNSTNGIYSMITGALILSLIAFLSSLSFAIYACIRKKKINSVEVELETVKLSQV